MSAQRLRRWFNLKHTLNQDIEFTDVSCFRSSMVGPCVGPALAQR